MSDRSDLEALFTRWGLPFQNVEADEPGENSTVSVGPAATGESEKVDGYDHFWAAFEFDEAGGFVKVGVWE